MPVLELTSAERKALRGQAMNLKPAVFIGKDGVTENVLGELDTALKRDQVIKVRSSAARGDFKAQLTEVCEKLGCALCGTVGHTASLYRPKPDGE